MSGNTPDHPYGFNPAEKPCDVCGNTDFAWGRLLAGEGTRHNQRLWFRPEGSAEEDGDDWTQVRRCTVCGNIKIFSEI